MNEIGIMVCGRRFQAYLTPFLPLPALAKPVASFEDSSAVTAVGELIAAIVKEVDVAKSDNSNDANAEHA